MSRFTVERPQQITMLGLGGTWGMKTENGVRSGQGVLGDEEIFRVERDLGVIDMVRHTTIPTEYLEVAIRTGEKRLAEYIFNRISNIGPIDAVEQVRSWCPEFGDYVWGELYNVFNGDSVHYRASSSAALTAYWLNKILASPQVPTVVGRGTDTADLEVTPDVDVQLFDTELPTARAAGSNIPSDQPGSDAPLNFTDTAKTVHIDQAPGSSWQFHGVTYSMADVNKFNPNENRQIEGRSTFIDPHNTAIKTATLLDIGRKADYSKAMLPPPGHPIHKINWETLFNAMSSVYTLDLGNQNGPWVDAAQIANGHHKAIVVAGHGTSAGNDIIREACVRAAHEGKLVLLTTRALVGMVEGHYATSLLGAGSEEDRRLHAYRYENQIDSDIGPVKLVNGGKLSRAPLRAIATRALLEGLDQNGAQRLLDRYAQARGLAA